PLHQPATALFLHQPLTTFFISLTGRPRFCYVSSVARIIFAFNGDLESRLALHWLVHERGHEVVALSINLGQEVYLEPLGELALELGAVSAQVLDRREAFLRDFAVPVLQANAVYQESCFLGSALARYVIAQELVRVAHEEG